MSAASTVEADDDDGSEAVVEATSTDDEEWTDAEPTAAPPRLSVVTAVGLGAVAAAFLAAGSLLAGGVGLLAVALLAAALSAVSRRLCSVAGGGFVLAFLAGGATAAPPAPAVGGAVLAVAAWDVADHGLGLAAQVGREARTTRNELVHAAASLGVSSAAGAVAFGAYLAAAGGQPAPALVFLLVGGAALLAALRR